MTIQQVAPTQAKSQGFEVNLPPHTPAQITQDQSQEQRAQAQTEQNHLLVQAQQQQRHKIQHHTPMQHTTLQQTNSSTPDSTIENGCIDPARPEDVCEEHGSEALLDTPSITVFDAMSDGCRRDAQPHPAQVEPCWLDLRPTSHISKRRKIDRSHSPASFAKFSCEACHHAQIQLQELLFKISVLQEENQHLKEMIQPYAGLKWVTIYEVSEGGSTRWYEDQPHWLQAQDRQVVLAGKKRIFRLKAFIRQLKLAKMSFIVFQEFTDLKHPDISTQHIQQWQPPTSSNVSILIISNQLSKTFRALFDNHPELHENADFRDIFDDDDDDDESLLDGDDSADASEIGQRLINIDLLYFHFQDLFEKDLNSRTEDERSETEPLLKFLTTGFMRNHGQARDLLSQGKTSKNTIFYLFKPGSVIVSQQSSRIRGLEQMHFPRTSSEGWNIECQSWTFDSKFHRKCETLLLSKKDLKNDADVNITSLPFYPLKYAEPEIGQKLLQRGRTFWKFRKPVYVTYSGLNMRGDTAYVSRFYPIFLI